jgi:pimeloyl-ACP methyl ester carboxylesterase
MRLLSCSCTVLVSLAGCGLPCARAWKPGRLIIPDLPGHEESSGEEYISHSATVKALANLVMQLGGHPVAVVGFSLGAQLSIGLAAQHAPLVSKFMVVSAQAKPMAGSRLIMALLGMSAPLARKRWFARLQAGQLFIPPELMEQYLHTSAGITRATLTAAVEQNLRFVLPERWSRFPGRALVMAGRRERKLLRDSAAAVHAALPESSLEILDGCGHGIPLQRPDQFNARVSAWLSP